ncbi:MAG: hypothetical protein IH591_10050 [Bacteroidales bacterium]|nr:hypothetical protein [Bacteroidales bacterium]
MKLRISHIILRAVAWHRGSYITLALVAALIAAVITASLLAGHSVRQTLTANTVERLNGGAIMVSAGLRYSDRDMAARLEEKTGVPVAPLMEMHGRISTFGGGAEVNGVTIWGVDSSFLYVGGAASAEAGGSGGSGGSDGVASGDRADGSDEVDTDVGSAAGEAGTSSAGGETPGRGEVILNSRLAEALNVTEGESVIVRFAAPSDLPRNTPFSPAKEESEGSLFLTVKKIVASESYGVFNPSISQVVPLNAFINADELNQFLEGRKKANRFLFQYNADLSVQTVEEALSEVSLPGGQSLRLRRVPATGQTEIISDRIFIDREIVDAITTAIPGTSPVITYLANSITSAAGATPYSFVTALSGEAVSLLSDPFDIAVNEWLANDIQCATGDTITLTYFLSGDDGSLTETSTRFRVAAVVPLEGVWRDSLLMPAFPGIIGSRSCTDWDAGIPLDMKRIRDKDEEYWNDYEGTPKAFIRYETGAALWGNQFGPATAIRWSTGNRQSVTPNRQPATGNQQPATGNIFPGSYAAELSSLIGTFGFVISDLRTDGLKAAVSGVDFSTLFLALSFFIIVSALVLLIMIMDNHLRSREGEMAAYSALGFTAGRIRMIFLGEALLPVTAGALLGTIAGIIFNVLIIKALNSVWIGAVQTDTLRAFAGAGQLITGAVATLFVAMAVVVIRIRYFLRQLNLSVRMRSVPDGRIAGILLWPAALLTAGTILMILLGAADAIMLHFVAGMLLFVLFILIFRRVLTPARDTSKNQTGLTSSKDRLRKNQAGGGGWFLSQRYYAFYPSRALTPLIFIAAGLFIVISTGANRQDFSRDAMKRSSGTGGFTHWIESSIPVDDGLMFDGADAVMRCLKVDGDDASCLNLNHITSPHLLGVDAAMLAERESFALATALKGIDNFGGTSDNDFWHVLTMTAGDDAIYGFLDQTVMQWGMMLKPSDTVTVRSESGRPLHVIIAGGLKTSVFQGHLLIDKTHFSRWFPSVPGSNILLIDAPQLLQAPFPTPPGATAETTPSRMESFYRVTNTYLSVFVVLGAIGMILGVMGMGLNLVKNIRSRRREFALMTASGFTTGAIRRMLLRENLAILTAGVITGAVPAVVATLPSLSTGNGLPWSFIAGLMIIMIVTGSLATILSARTLQRSKVSEGLRKE